MGIHARRTFIRSAVRVLFSPDNYRSAVICFKCKTVVRGTYNYIQSFELSINWVPLTASSFTRSIHLLRTNNLLSNQHSFNVGRWNFQTPSSNTQGLKLLLSRIRRNKNAFQHDAYRKIQWPSRGEGGPPSGVSAYGGLPRGCTPRNQRQTPPSCEQNQTGVKTLSFRNYCCGQ